MKKILMEALLSQPRFNKSDVLMLFAFVFGWKPDSPTLINHYLKVTGMQHVAAASGFNVGLVLSSVSVVVGRCSPRLTYGFLLLCLGGYVVLTDHSAAIVRAMGMAIISLTVRLLGHRQYSAQRALVATCAVMVLVNWSYWQDLSFQLSVAATAGIIWFAPLSSAWCRWSTLVLFSDTGVPERQQTRTNQGTVLTKALQPISEALATTCAAQVTTLPLVFRHFGAIPLVTICANTALLGLVPVLTKIGFVVVGLGILTSKLPILGMLLRLCAACYLVGWHLFEAGVLFFGTLNWPSITITYFPWIYVWMWWLSLGLFCIYKEKPRKKPPQLWRFS